MLTIAVVVVTSHAYGSASEIRPQPTPKLPTNLRVTVLLGPTYTFDSYHHYLKHITKWDSILMSEEDIQVGLQIPLGRTVVDFRVFVQLSSAS